VQRARPAARRIAKKRAAPIAVPPSRARLSVRSALSQPTPMTVHFGVRVRTTSSQVQWVGKRIELLR